MPLIHSMQINPCKCGTDKDPNFDSDDMVPCWAVQCYVCKQFVHDAHWTMEWAVNEWNKENPITFKELDLVRSTVQIKNVPIGTNGTIVHLHEGNETFEVEFFQKRKTLSVETVSKNQKKKI